MIKKKKKQQKLKEMRGAFTQSSLCLKTTEQKFETTRKKRPAVDDKKKEMFSIVKLLKLGDVKTFLKAPDDLTKAERKGNGSQNQTVTINVNNNQSNREEALWK